MDLNLNNIIYYILIVDNDSDDHYFLRTALNKLIPQALIESVYKGEEALGYLNGLSLMPNVIFLGLNVSEDFGRTTMKTIRQNQVLNKVPVITFTSEVDKKEEEAEILALGASALYSKPCQIEEFMSLVEDVKNRYL
jgi:CheY-like chemotaxis protein